LGKSRDHRELAQRFAIYIRALGGTPLAFRHRTYLAYATALKWQYLRLKRSLDPKFVATVVRSAQVEIIEQTLPIVAEGLVPFLGPTPPTPRKEMKKRREKLEAFFMQNDQLVLKCPRCRMKCGLPKKSWPTRKMAEEAISRNQKVTDLEIYLCPHLKGHWHIGHTHQSGTGQKFRPR
jgi:hypothetical protein